MIEELLNNRVISRDDYNTLLKVYGNQSEMRTVFYDVLSEYIFDRLKELQYDID